MPVEGFTPSTYSVRWMGQVEAPVTGYYQFVTYSDDGVRLWINGDLVLQNWDTHAIERDVSRSVYLIEGQKVDIRLDYFQGLCNYARMMLAWIYPGQVEQIIPMERLYPTRSPDTIGIYRFTNNKGYFFLRKSNSTGVADIELELSFAQAGDIPIIGDWDGDGIDSVGLYRPGASGQNRFLLVEDNWLSMLDFEAPSVIPVSSETYNFVVTYSGGTGDYLPIVGKWTAGHTADRVGLYDRGSGTFVVYHGLTSGTPSAATPIGVDITPTPTQTATDAAPFGDWTGNVYSYAGVFRPSSGVWYLYQISPFAYGNPNDIAVVGDWDGDFADGVGIYRSDNAAFHLKYVASGGAADLSFTYGNSGDLYPFAGRWAYQTLQPTPSSCLVTVKAGKTAYFRIQPHLDDQGLTPVGENWLYQLLPTPTGTPYPYPYLVGTIAPSSWLWQSLGASTPLAPYAVADIRQIASIGVIPWIHPTVQWIQVEVQSSVGAVIKGYLNLTDPADGSAVLDVSGSCSTGNVPTPEVTMPTAPPATAVMPTMYSIFGGLNNIGTSTPTPAPKIAPAVMGTCLLHDGSVLPCGPSSSYSTIDLVPRNIELCTDARDMTRIDECDPDLGEIPGGIPIYSPVKGCIFYTAGLNIVIEFSPTNDPYLDECDRSTLWDEEVRYQISITHLVPTYTTQNWSPIEAGAIIGRLCTENEWFDYPAPHSCEGPVALATDSPPHLAFHLFISAPNADSFRVAELPNDVRGFLARPNCFFDSWKSTNGSTPVLQSPTPGQPSFACPNY